MVNLMLFLEELIVHQIKKNSSMIFLLTYLNLIIFVLPLLLPLLNDQILHEYKKDKYYKEIWKKKLNSKQNFPKSNKFSLSNNFLHFNGKIYVPFKCRSSVLNICHNSQSTGYFGFKKTFSLINNDFWWSSM